MKRTLTKWSEPVCAALRIVAGFMMLWHGAQKVFGDKAISFGDQPQIWIGGLFELACGIAIAAGLLTRWAAILISGTMAVAFFQFQMGGNWSPAHLLPLVNKGELAALYAFVFLFVATKGPGLASVDRALGLDE